MATISPDIITPSFEVRYWEKVERRNDAECWYWAAHKNSKGYGQFGIGGKAVKATHVAIALDGRPLPPGAIVMHSCDNPSCVNPKHLLAGSVADYNADRKRKGRYPNTFPSTKRAIGVDNGRAVMTVDIAKQIKESSLSCQKLARHFGVGVSTVSDVRRGRTWRHVQDAIERGDHLNPLDT